MAQQAIPQRTSVPHALVKPLRIQSGTRCSDRNSPVSRKADRPADTRDDEIILAGIRVQIPHEVGLKTLACGTRSFQDGAIEAETLAKTRYEVPHAIRAIYSCARCSVVLLVVWGKSKDKLSAISHFGR